MKTLVFSALFALFLSGCAGAGLAVLAPAVDGGVANERGQTSYVAKGIHWACDKVGGTYEANGDCTGPL
jgi:phosphatidylglycerophosphate synthase